MRRALATRLSHLLPAVCLQAACLAVMVFAIPLAARAADVSWAAGSGAYSVGSNWATGVVPTGTDALAPESMAGEFGCSRKSRAA